MTQGAGKGNGTVFAWCLYDWASSAFPAVITTFVFATYFTQAVAADVVTGTAMWGHATAISGLFIAILGPVVGAIADHGGRQKPWLAAFTALAVVACAALWFVRPNPADALFALVAFGIATVAFEIATVFYNALLPKVASPERLGRISGWGWGLGYVGGIVCLAILLVGFVQNPTPPFGIDRDAAEHVRAVGPFTGLWWAVFALPVLLVLRETGPQASWREALKLGFADIRGTLAFLRARRDIAWFLVANMIYTDGLTTLFAFGAIYAAGSFGMQLEEVIVFGIALNLSAGIGAFGFAWLDDRIGSRRTIAIGLVCLTAIGAALLAIESKTAFWILGVAIGPFFGPVQAASRSLAARIAPPEHRAQVFGLFALSGRITAFMGPAVLGTVTLAFDSQRAGMATILPFFLVGFIVLWRKVADPAKSLPDD
ncbi:MAG: MFS transporter [Proteobacteria bacterium]|nr:MFS transporter [Pseudomonadota bacterium]